jgi:hypothetical protein
MRFHVGDETFQIVRRQRFLGDQQHRIDGDQTDRREIGPQIETDIVDDAADMGVPLADVDGVAVGRCAREPADADRAAGAAEFSTITGWPSAAPILSAMMRAATSVDPPGGNDTIKVIGREGKLSARARERNAKNVSAIAVRNFRMVPACF